MAFPELTPVFMFAMIVDGLGWLALLLLPKERIVTFWFSNVIVPMLLLIVCLYCVFTDPHPLYLHFTSFVGTVGTLQNKHILLDAWSHILMADLVVGAWMTRRAAATELPRLPMAIVLVVTYLFSPGGLALFFILAAWKGKLSRIGAD